MHMLNLGGFHHQGLWQIDQLIEKKLWNKDQANNFIVTRPKSIRMRGKHVSGKAMLILCIASFFAGSLFSTTSRTWITTSSSLDVDEQPNGGREAHPFPIVSKYHIHNHLDDNGNSKGVAAVDVAQTNCNDDHKRKLVEGKSSADDIMGEVTKQAIKSLDKTISTLEMELAEARASSQRIVNPNRQKAFVVIGINTAFSSKKRRKSVRETWMPTGGELRKLEKQKGIVIRFVIGQSANPGGLLDRAVEAEEADYNDFLRLNHVEGYHELSTKTRLYFSTAISIWDADFYVKVDDDVHLNLGTLATTLAKHRTKPRIYIGCMKSGPVLYQKGVKYHEPEYWKFGEEGNKYFRHATGQIYAISKDLAAYISTNLPILHRYANEDVSLGSWFIGLEVEHIDERSMCCATPPDCGRMSQAGNVCVASFDWKCSGICNSVERMKEVHTSCGEGTGAVWNFDL